MWQDELGEVHLFVGGRGAVGDASPGRTAHILTRVDKCESDGGEFSQLGQCSIGISLFLGAYSASCF